MATFNGVIPPLATPLTNEGDVDLPSLGRMVERLIAAGVDGLFALGTTGEAIFHDAKNRQRIIEHVVAVNNGRLPVFVGVIDPATDRVIGHAKIAKAAGVDAIVATAPFYAQVDQREVTDHFRAIHRAVDLPLVAYDIPFCTHIKLRRSTVAQLVREGVVAGLKDSSGDNQEFRRLLLDLADQRHFSAFTGSEILVDAALSMGAHGVVPGIGNVDPEAYVRLWQAYARGDLGVARSEQERLCRLVAISEVGMGRVGLSSSLFGGVKTALRELGVIETNMVSRPQQPLNTDEATAIRTILEEEGLTA
jgi:4-hydroxy-tetrahydrodipicolinate synthase